MASPKTFDDLFVDEIRDLYDAEKQLTKALPKLAKAATSTDLRSAIEAHLEETRTHVERLTKIFELLDEPARGKHCSGIAGIIEEGGEVLDADVPDVARDAAIIAGAQRAEHYEMAAYGSAIAWAKSLGKTDVADVLAETLEEEKAADEKLTEIAESGINEEAAGASTDDTEAVVSPKAKSARTTTSSSRR